MKARGHPVLGGIAGFFLLLFVGVDLLVFGVLPLNSPLLSILPLVGIVLGVAWAWWAPLGHPPAAPPVPPEPPEQPPEQPAGVEGT